MKQGDLVKLGWFGRGFGEMENDRIGMIIKVDRIKRDDGPVLLMKTYHKIEYHVQWADGDIKVYDKGMLNRIAN